MAIRAVQYVRMSTEHQRYSLETQAAVISAYALERGFEIVRTYSDAGKSGLTLKGRHGLQKLLSDALNPERDFSAILVLDVSRWGRFQDADQAAHYEFICREAGLAVAYCAEQFENDGGPVGSIVKHLKRVMAGEYSRELSSKITAAKKQQARLGFRQGGPPLYGFRRQLITPAGGVRVTLEPGERKAYADDRVRFIWGPQEEVAIVRRIFRYFVRDRLSFVAISRRLNDAGVMSCWGDGSWSSKSIATLLRSPLYRGDYVYNRTTQRLRTKRRAVAVADWITTRVVAPMIGPRTFALAQELAGRGHRNRYSDRQLLEALRRLLAREGRITFKLVVRAKDVPHWETYQQRFGSIRQACALIGYSRPKGRWVRGHGACWTDSEMLEELRRLRLKYGHLSAAVIGEDERAPSVGAYQRRFGSLLKAYGAAGFPLTYRKCIRDGMRRLQARAQAARTLAPAMA